MSEEHTLGFIGLGVMGEHMASNLLAGSGRPVWVHDLEEAPRQRLSERGARVAGSNVAVGEEADIVFLSLPSIVQVEAVCTELLESKTPPLLVVDMSTSDVVRTRLLAERLTEAGIAFLDAPVARLRKAARDGTLLITVGGSQEDFARANPYLLTMGSDVIHCGGVGTGQTVKVLNNMVVFMNVRALAEAVAIGRGAGLDGQQLLEALALGSADSFALRNAGLKAIAPDEFPVRTFPTTYAIKDIRLALELATAVGVHADGAMGTAELLERTKEAGFADNYYPAMIRVIDGRAAEK